MWRNALHGGRTSQKGRGPPWKVSRVSFLFLLHACTSKADILLASLKVAAGYLLNATSFAVPKDTLPPLDFETLSPLHLSLFAEACAIKRVGDSVVRHPDVADPTDIVIRWMWKPLQSQYDISHMRSTAGMVSRDKPYLPADPAKLLMEQKTDIAPWLACFASSQWTSWTRQDDDVGGPDATIWGTLEVVDATEWRDTNELPPPGWWFAESVAISTAEQAEDEDSSDPGTEPDVETGKRPGVFWDPDTDLSD
jgi:hypothetical protein